MQETRLANLTERPNIFQAGYGVHGARKVESYKMQNLWCLHLYDYEADLEIDGVLLSIKKGSISIASPGSKLVYRYQGKSPHFFFHFTLKTESDAEQPLPFINQPGAFGTGLRVRLENAALQWTQNKLWSEIRLWDALWALSEQHISQKDQPSWEPKFTAITKAIGYIEKNLALPIGLGDVADITGYSQNHLNRLFKKRFNQTVSSYIMLYRMNRAAHWLKHTNWPIKEIAHEVGFHDLHHFNKAFKRIHGIAPRNYRLLSANTTEDNTQSVNQ
ncbi:helix-turn-helix transcriptional regulator [Rubellicoccus peritrichatus]|uniref:Helix-turn-helix transcriptional regulator n=1 Tax=Rubellicoccus peritrichatus TaxID=3080537 RepID=A0AAQ3L6W7_9BACT|nr:helix-turn-helix transcriptional regulator [Puniceicoccus sp. CR14]WOO40166.1 helix-turn-helix transcriptional regulator [Puniceicoccus sp. CR14]